jgi:hypothetical protein
MRLAIPASAGPLWLETDNDGPDYHAADQSYDE